MTNAMKNKEMGERVIFLHISAKRSTINPLFSIAHSLSSMKHSHIMTRKGLFLTCGDTLGL